LKFDIKHLVQCYVRRNKAYEALGTIDRAILQCNEFPSALADLAEARYVIRDKIAEYEKPFQGKNGEARSHLCEILGDRFLVDKLGSNSLESVMDYLNEIANEDPEPTDP